MKSNLRSTITFVVAILITALGPSWLHAQAPGDNQLFSAGDVDTLLAPIALYPDPLLSQMLPAATYPDDIQAAADLVARHPRNHGLIDAQPWDLSVKAVAHYPNVIEQMAGDMEWTLALGQAYGQQRLEVFDAIQRLRREAWDAGTLRSSPQQRVYTELGVIRIVPAHAQYMYIPRYDPEVVYVRGPLHRPGLLSFSAGFMIGAWLNTDLDWRGHRVYYHGWSGPGWIAYSRPHVHMSSFYVHDRYRQWRWYNPTPRFHGRPVVRDRVYVDRHFSRYEFNRNRPGYHSAVAPHNPPRANERFRDDHRVGPSNRPGFVEEHRRIDTPHRPPVVTERARPDIGHRPENTGGRTFGREAVDHRRVGDHNRPAVIDNRSTGGNHRFGGGGGNDNRVNGGRDRFGGNDSNRINRDRGTGGNDNQATGGRNRFGGGGSGFGNNSGNRSGGGQSSGGNDNQATGGRGRFGGGGGNNSGHSGGGQDASSNSNRPSNSNDGAPQGGGRSGGGPRGDGESRKSRH